MKRILVTYNMFREGFRELESKYDVTFPAGENEYFSYNDVIRHIHEYDALCPMYDFPVNKELLDKGTRLKLVANYAVGYDNIDVACALDKGVVVANTPDQVTEPTANLALALLLSVARRVSEFDRKLHEQGKSVQIGVGYNLGLPVEGRMLGIIGMGRIGKALCRRARACGMTVCYHNRHRLPSDEEISLGATYLSKDELLEKADFVSLNAPLTPETYHTIGEKELNKMKPAAILINTARGPLIDEKALITALENKQIHGAGLDMFEFGDYPSPELLTMDNVVLTPHFGTQTTLARLGMAKAVCDNVIGFFENDRPVKRVLRP
ncbi:MAG: dihydrofolate reductase [Tannerella sp.]|jgi:lactate dehydrogenase-like 2-hydroxyacid dehydrogenase|nr:dihydrofolate reductase [Tannerella sp.]